MKPKAHISTEWDRDLSAAHIVQDIEGSLRRLKTEYVDLYQAHADDLDTPLDETLRAFEQLIESGCASSGRRTMIPRACRRR